MNIVIGFSQLRCSIFKILFIRLIQPFFLIFILPVRRTWLSHIFSRLPMIWLRWHLLFNLNLYSRAELFFHFIFRALLWNSWKLHNFTLVHVLFPYRVCFLWKMPFFLWKFRILFRKSFICIIYFSRMTIFKIQKLAGHYAFMLIM